MRYILFILTFFLFLACGRSEFEKAPVHDVELNSNEEKQEEQQQVQVADSTASFSPPHPGEPNQTPKPSQSPESKPDWNKKIIKAASLNVEVLPD